MHVSHQRHLSRQTRVRRRGSAGEARARPRIRAKGNGLPARGQARRNIKGGLDDRTIASVAKRSRQGRQPGHPDVAKAIAGQPAGSDTNAIVGSGCRAAVAREIASRGRLAALANARGTRVEKTPAAGSGSSWYGRCSCGWHGHLRISQAGARDDAASHQQAAITSRSGSTAL